MRNLEHRNRGYRLKAKKEKEKRRKIKDVHSHSKHQRKHRPIFDDDEQATRKY